MKKFSNNIALLLLLTGMLLVSFDPIGGSEAASAQTIERSTIITEVPHFITRFGNSNSRVYFSEYDQSMGGRISWVDLSSEVVSFDENDAGAVRFHRNTLLAWPPNIGFLGDASQPIEYINDEKGIATLRFSNEIFTSDPKRLRSFAFFSGGYLQADSLKKFPISPRRQFITGKELGVTGVDSRVIGGDLSGKYLIILSDRPDFGQTEITLPDDKSGGFIRRTSYFTYATSSGMVKPVLTYPVDSPSGFFEVSANGSFILIQYSASSSSRQSVVIGFDPDGNKVSERVIPDEAINLLGRRLQISDDGAWILGVKNGKVVRLNVDSGVATTIDVKGLMIDREIQGGGSDWGHSVWHNTEYGVIDRGGEVWLIDLINLKGTPLNYLPRAGGGKNWGTDNGLVATTNLIMSPDGSVVAWQGPGIICQPWVRSDQRPEPFDYTSQTYNIVKISGKLTDPVARGTDRCQSTPFSTVADGIHPELYFCRN